MTQVVSDTTEECLSFFFTGQDHGSLHLTMQMPLCYSIYVMRVMRLGYDMAEYWSNASSCYSRFILVHEYTINTTCKLKCYLVGN